VEFRERLQQLDWLFERVQEIQHRHDEAFENMKTIMNAHFERIKREGLSVEQVPIPEAAKASPERASEIKQEAFEMKMFAESFYYFAGRARALARSKEEPLPGLRSFEAEGVRNVRNHLIEHPEGASSRVFIASWGTGSGGPVMKAARYEGQEDVFPDAGFFANAVEFRERLNALLVLQLRAYGL
jgi:hypothetical protein